MNDEIKEIRDILFELQFLGNEETQSKVVKLHNYITNLQQKIEQYENPDDMTLFYMWLDVKAKDKMKELEQENEDYKSRCEKAIDKLTIKQARFINEKDYVLDDNDLDEIMYILQNGGDDND